MKASNQAGPERAANGKLVMVATPDLNDLRWMQMAIALSEQARGTTAPNPNVGCVIVKDEALVGRGWTQPRGRPHAEAIALENAGAAARGATIYVTLEPCAHLSPRGPACVDLIIATAPARVVVASIDPDPRTRTRSIARLRAAGIEVVEGVEAAPARRAMAGFFTRQAFGRPHVTLKLAMSIDGCIALSSGESQWITGPESREHTHLERAKADAILVGRATFDEDHPRLDVRIAGLEHRSPRRLILSRRQTDGQTSKLDADGWTWISDLSQIASLPDVDHLLVEGGSGVAASFLAADLVDRLLIYRAPILVGDGKHGVGDIGLTHLADAHRRWRQIDLIPLGVDRLETYERLRPEAPPA